MKKYVVTAIVIAAIAFVAWSHLAARQQVASARERCLATGGIPVSTHDPSLDVRGEGWTCI